MQSKRWHCMCTLFCDNNKLNVLDSGCFLRHSCWGVLAKIRHFFQSGQGITLWEQLKTLALLQFLNPLHSILPDLDWSQKNYARWWITIMADKWEWWMYLDKTEWIIYSFASGNCLKNKQEIVGLPQPNPFIKKTGN